MCDQQRLRPACAYAQSDQSLRWLLEHSMNTQLLTKHNLEPLRLKGGCSGLSESTLDKMPHCWKSHVTAHCVILIYRLKVSGGAGDVQVAFGFHISCVGVSVFSLLKKC